MAERKTKLKSFRKGKADPKEYARRAREINERLHAKGRYFGDSTEIIRADRGSRV